MSARGRESVMDQIDSVIHQYLKRYGTLEGMKKEVFIDPLYYQHWTSAVKAPFNERVRPPEVDLFLNDIHEGFSYVQQLLSTIVRGRMPLIENRSTDTARTRDDMARQSFSENITLEDPNTFAMPEAEDVVSYPNPSEEREGEEEEDYEEEEEDYEEEEEEDYEEEDYDKASVQSSLGVRSAPETTAQLKPFSAMSVDDQLTVRAATVCQVLESFVGSSIMSGLEFIPNRVVQLLPGLLEGRPAAQSADYNTAVWCLTQMMAYLGIQSIDAELSIVSFDDHGNPVRYSMNDVNFPIGELYAKWR